MIRKAQIMNYNFYEGHNMRILYLSKVIDQSFQKTRFFDMTKIQRSWCIALKKGSMVKTMFYKVVAYEKYDIFFFGHDDWGVHILP